MRFLEDVDEAAKIAREEMKLLDEMLDDILPQYGPGFRAPQTKELPAWLMAKRQEYPPAEWILPDGRTVNESIYLLALPYVEGGEKLLRRVLEYTEG